MLTCAPDPRHTATDSILDARWNLNIAQLLLEYLKLEGATKIFGIPGGALILLMEELRLQKDTFDFIICRHETGAAYIAHGYAAVSGNLGVVMTTSGPAATNALTGLMNAQTSNVPLLAITGEVSQDYYGQGYLQEGTDSKLDIDTIYRNAVEYSAVISTVKNFPILFEQALRDALSTPPRAAHISLPNNLGAQCAAGVNNNDGLGIRIPFPKSPDTYRAAANCTDPAKVRATVDELAAAARPLIFMGNGARQALADPVRLANLMTFVETFGIPVMTTPDAKGIFPESHALSLRNYGMGACTWPTIYMGQPGDPDHYDALCVIGSTLGELATTVLLTDTYSKNLIPSTFFTQIDLDASQIGRSFPVTRGIVGEAGATIDAICAYGQSITPDSVAVKKRLNLIADLKQSNNPFADPDGRASENAPTHPASLCRVIEDALVTAGGGHLFIDAGNCVGWSLQNIMIDPPVRFHSALGMGPMGFGVGAVIGGKMAAPDVPCLALVGDGAFMMHGAEISTAAQYGIGAIWVVLYDNDLAMVTQGMGALFPPVSDWKGNYPLGSPDLAGFASSLGAQAVNIGSDQGPDDFAKALQTAIDQATKNNRPQVVVVHIDTVPMPAYGWPNMSSAIPQCGQPGCPLPS